MTSTISFPAPQRYITTNSNNGQSTFASHFHPDPPLLPLPDGPKISFCYGTDHFPVNLNQDQDLQSYQHLIDNPPGIVVPNGFACRIIDMLPGYTSAMHRTISVNFNVVIEGQLELILDSRETRILSRGDSAIQRASNHAWRNVSSTAWARLAAVPVPAETLQIGDKKVEGTGVPGMSASS